VALRRWQKQRWQEAIDQPTDLKNADLPICPREGKSEDFGGKGQVGVKANDQRPMTND
jgi:hypothetical protein